jgi:ABC-2 type transport system permease protein
VIEKLAALATEVAALALVLFVALLVGVEAVGMNVAIAHLAAATASAALLAFAFGAIALLLGAVTGRRAIAIGVAASGAVAAYLVSSLSALVDFLDAVKVASPFYHYVASDPLRHGLALDHVAFLVLLAGSATWLAVLGFERREVAN